MTRGGYRLAWTLLPPLVAVQAGCRLESAFEGARYRCTPSESCPEGTACSSDGYCEPIALADAALADATALCDTDASFNGLDRLTADPAAWESFASAGAAATLESGEVRLSVPDSFGSAQAGFRTRDLYSVADSGLTVHVSAPPSGTAWLIAALEFTGGEIFRMGIGQGQIAVLWFVDGQWNTIHSEQMGLDSDHWQIRHSAGRLRFEVAADAQDWRELSGDPNPPAEEAVVILTLEDEFPRDTIVDGGFDAINADKSSCPSPAESTPRSEPSGSPRVRMSARTPFTPPGD